MPKVSIKATELTNTDVDFIALVKRGANRIPFRLTKSEDEPMLDLFSAGKRLLMKGDAPRVIGVVYTTKADIPALMALLKDEGIEVAALQKTEDSGVCTLLAKDVDVHDALLVKTGDTVALVVSHMRKGFSDHELTTSPYTSERHVTSPAAATAIYKGLLDEAMKTAETPAAYSAQVSKAANQFDAYMIKLGASLPSQALKMERALVKAGTGNANGGGATNQETGDGLGDKANTAAATQKLENGTGDGFEVGKDTGTTPAATADDASGTRADAKPGDTVSGDSSGLYMHKDGVLHRMPRSYGTFEITAEAGNFATVKWTFTGTYDAAVDDPNPAPVFETTLPEQVQLARLWVNQFHAIVQKFSFNQANDIQIRPDVSSSDGYAGTRITSRKPEGGIDPEADLVANNDFWGHFAAATRMPLQMRVGLDAGNTVWIIAPNTQYSGMTYQDRNGIMAYDAGLRFGRSVGNDEIFFYMM